jgi:DNA-binding transcriptional ArsR family regulator
MVKRSRRLDATFRALADPTRRAILARLRTGERTISELATGFAMTLPAVSKHVYVLERAGLMGVRLEGRVRRCRLEPAALREAEAWMSDYREFWETSLDKLEQYAASTSREAGTGWQASERDRSQDSSSVGRSQRRGSGSGGRGRKRMD